MSIEARNRLLPDWFTRIRTHQTVLPRFQRFEAWDHSRVTQMFNTILQDLPVGSGLVLEVGDEEPFISRTLKGAPEEGERATEHLLDGQHLAERRDGTDLGDAEVTARLATHLIPYEGMVAGDYPAFLAARANLIHSAMTALCASGGTGERE